MLNNVADVSSDTVYDFSLERTEANSAKYLAISPCHACYTFNSSPCSCGKYLFCDIMCQVGAFSSW